jgi:two-component sensor histidine kinase
VHQARADLLAVLTGWGLAGVVDDATLVLGELMTNALRHGRVGDRRIGTTFSRTPHGDGVVLEVHDAHDGVPVLKDADELAEHGRGLAIVDALTSGHWGVADREGPGKVVWAVCTGTPPPAP